ncbi:MAG TPA: hypothetical protein VFU37_09415 [Pyrinomonadaceae bacterium]|nr:hypothetical protein [Pyrinomonadaceae bacterium]
MTAFEAPLAATPDIWTLPTDYFEQVERSIRMHAAAVMETAVAN